MTELGETLEAARRAGLDVKVEWGQSSLVLTLNGRRWILRDDAELALMLSLHMGSEAQRAWLERRRMMGMLESLIPESVRQVRSRTKRMQRLLQPAEVAELEGGQRNVAGRRASAGLFSETRISMPGRHPALWPYRRFG